MEYCFHVGAGAPSCYMETLDELQKRIRRTVDPLLAPFLETLAHRRNVAFSSELARLVPGFCHHF